MSEKKKNGSQDFEWLRMSPIKGRLCSGGGLDEAKSEKAPVKERNKYINILYRERMMLNSRRYERDDAMSDTKRFIRGRYLCICPAVVMISARKGRRKKKKRIEGDTRPSIWLVNGISPRKLCTLMYLDNSSILAKRV